MAVIIFGYTHVSVQYLPGQNELLSDSFPFLADKGDVEVCTGKKKKKPKPKHNTTPKTVFGVCVFGLKNKAQYNSLNY